MADKKPGMALLIGVGKPKGKPMADDGDGPDAENPAEDSQEEAKMAASRAMISALRGGDPEAFASALDDFLSAR